ncbi:glycosyltransferase [Halalkalicoccus subterraneus]|uniref:glycosyltransferase n=1 Tax=Halalkalicoccus subterraneus TaxID=2675002 RepID=UPI000EFC8D18|nr:glycosyltransferase family A protein [Halalkalicoccus subterraneus]
MKTSVVVPVYNDPDGLSTTVESLLDQRATDYEVVVADNGSTDRTTAVARSFAESDRVRHVIEDDVQSSYAARNAGIEAATGDVIGFVDADMWVEDDYVSSITRAMAGRAYLGCDVDLVAGSGIVSRYRQASGFPIEKYVTEDHFAPTCCLVVRRRLLDEIGPFDARLVSNGDLEFGRRAHEAGFAVHYEPTITLHHPARSTLRDVIAQNVRIGRGREQIRRYHGDRFEVRGVFEPRNYLPVDPFRFRESLVERPERRSDLLLWYLLACLQKWARTAGYLRQRRADSPHSVGYHGSA